MMTIIRLTMTVNLRILVYPQWNRILVQLTMARTARKPPTDTYSDALEEGIEELEHREEVKEETSRHHHHHHSIAWHPNPNRNGNRNPMRTCLDHARKIVWKWGPWRDSIITAFRPTWLHCIEQRRCTRDRFTIHPFMIQTTSTKVRDNYDTNHHRHTVDTTTTTTTTKWVRNRN